MNRQEKIRIEHLRYTWLNVFLSKGENVQHFWFNASLEELKYRCFLWNDL